VQSYCSAFIALKPGIKAYLAANLQIVDYTANFVKEGDDADTS